MKVLKIGLKIWSTNQNYLSSIKALKGEGMIDYIELFVAPDSTEDHIRIWEDLNVPFLLHAPHSYAGLNFSDEECEQKNRLLIDKVKLFMLSLRAKKIIFHPGINGTVEETIRQINMFNNEFPARAVLWVGPCSLVVATEAAGADHAHAGQAFLALVLVAAWHWCHRTPCR